MSAPGRRPAAAGPRASHAARGWWTDAVVYEIYPRSFADSDGNGIGDLQGVTSRLDYLAELGIDAIWLTPFYPSPLADGGYDITDYRDVDPQLGSLADFDHLVEAAHARGVRVVVDIVPNHTSDQHPWFRDALAAGPAGPERARYVFRDGQGDGSQPPTDWRSHFGGSAWERLPEGQWYLHLFTREQPDLNWDCEEVREYFEDTLRFWADRGVDGFRVDVAHGLAKDLKDPLRSQSILDARLPLDGSDPLYDRDEVHAIYRSWRRVLDEYDPPKMAVAETWTPTTERTYLYARADELGQVFDFSLLKSGWDAAGYQRIINRSLADHARHSPDGAGLTWVLSSHDVQRHVTRLGLDAEIDLDAWLIGNGAAPRLDLARGRRRALAATLMMLALPGSAYLYQGEELGLPEVADLAETDLRDPIHQRTNGTLKGRDGCRVPIPWTPDGSSYGFGTNGSWLPQPPLYGELSVQRQVSDPDSTLSLYRAALAARRALLTDDVLVTWLSADPDTLRFVRTNGWQCVVNFSTTAQPLPPGQVVLASGPLPGDGTLPGETCAWLTV